MADLLARLDPAITVLMIEHDMDIALEVARTGRAGRWTLDRIYELFPHLCERAINAGDKLSGGEQQMLAIGRALMTNPDLILMDEPTEGLAPLLVRSLPGGRLMRFATRITARAG